MKSRPIRRIAIFFLLITGVLIAVAVFAVRNISRSAANADWVNHTHAVILEAQALLSDLYAGDAAIRTYLLTGEGRDRAAARQAFARAQEHVEVLQPLVGAGGAGEDMSELARLVKIRTDLAADLSLRRANQTEPPASLLAADIDSGTTSEIRQRLERLKAHQMLLLAERDTASYLQAQTTRWTVWVAVALDVLLLAGVVWLIREDIAARRQVVNLLEAANQELDSKVRARTAELATSNEQLSLENLERQWTTQALEHQLRYDRLIIDSINDLVLVLTKAMNISRVNPAVTQVTGFDAPDLINHPLALFLEFGPGRSRAPVLSASVMSQALKAGREARGVGRLRSKTGGAISVRVTLCPLRDGDKVVGGVVILEVVAPPADTLAL